MRTLRRPSVLAASLAILLGAGAFWAAGQDQGGDGRKAQDKQISDTLRAVINKGADYFNENKDFNGCARLFEGALLTVRPQLAHHPALQREIDQGLGEAGTLASPIDRAFALRRTLDAVRDGLRGVLPPTDKKPTDKKPTDIKPTDKKPTDVKPTDKKPTDKKFVPKATLWDRMGGLEKVARAVDLFIQSVGTDKDVDFTRGGKYKIDPKHMRKELIDLVSQVTGGPFDYTGKGMKETHAGMKITDKEFDRTMTHARNALEQAGIKGPEASDLLKIIGSTREDIVGNGGGKQPNGKKVPDREKIPVKPDPVKKEIKKGDGTVPPPPPPGAGASVSGRVMYKGQPLTSGTVTFVPGQGGKQAGHTAALLDDGTYAVAKLPAGEYRIVIRTEPDAKDPGKTVPARIPAQYTSPDTTALRARIEPGRNTHDIELR